MTNAQPALGTWSQHQPPCLLNYGFHLETTRTYRTSGGSCDVVVRPWVQGSVVSVTYQLYMIIAWVPDLQEPPYFDLINGAHFMGGYNKASGFWTTNIRCFIAVIIIITVGSELSFMLVVLTGQTTQSHNFFTLTFTSNIENSETSSLWEPQFVWEKWWATAMWEANDMSGWTRLQITTSVFTALFQHSGILFFYQARHI